MNSEWLGNLQHIEYALMRDFYLPMEKIQWEGFVTDKNFTIDEAYRQEHISLPDGYVYGKPWHYAWMFAKLKLSPEMRGERIIMNLNPGGEATIFVNGKPFGTRRADFIEKSHHYYVDQTLTMEANVDEIYELACEVYGGHPMPRVAIGSCSTGPVFPEEENCIMEYKAATIGSNSYGIWNEEAYQLWLDILVLREIMENGDQQSYRVEAIEYGLKNIILEIDMEQELEKRRAVYSKMRELLKPFLTAKNGTSAPQFYTIANSHLDIAWMWDMDTTRRKTARTFAAQLRLLDEYPEMKFIQSQPILYEMCREHYPDLFDKIRKKVKNGQWVADGAMWVEPDTNLASGESLVRQFLYGKKYFKEEFGIESKLCWLPDTFGYSAAVPQILKGCEVDYLTTQKIYWTYNDSQKFPYHGFSWEGMDGSKIKTYVHMEYESKVNPARILKHWNSRLEKDGTGKFFLPYGYGDGGGGPTRDDLEQIERASNLEGIPKMKHTTPYEFMVDIEHTSDLFTRNIFKGELYFPCHRGTYTTQANVKRDNRKTEIAMHDAECWNAISQWEESCEYQFALIEENWKSVLLNQFHDILPGSSIGKVYEDAKKLYEKIYVNTDFITNHALRYMLKKGDGVTYFNGTSFEREEYVILPNDFLDGAKYLDGKEVMCTKSSQGVLARIKVQPYGHVTLVPASKTNITKQVFLTKLANGAYRLENEQLLAIIERDGTLSQLISKQSNCSYINKKGNYFQLFRDIPRKFDAWDIDVMVEQCEILSDSIDVQLMPIIENELEVVIQMKRTIGNSIISQDISLRAGERKIDFDTTIDWKELHKLLKVSFATGIKVNQAKNQIQFGYIERPTHRSLPSDADRFEVCNHFYTALQDSFQGAAIINDSKYGISMLGDVLSLSLLKTGAHPDFRSDNHVHHFSYSFTFWDTPWSQSPIVKDAYCFNYKLLNSTGFASEKSYFHIDKDNIILETVKLAEDQSGDMILRLYESKQGFTISTITINMSFQEVYECNMLENRYQEIKADNHKIELSFYPFEVKTLRITKD